MRISDAALLIVCAALAAGCRERPGAQETAAADAGQTHQAAETQRIECALAGATAFRADCTVERIASAEGRILVIGRTDGGFRRFRVTSDGRGIIAADGAEPAEVRVVGDGQIEVRVANDRYRPPATVR
jgi:hypothetical protein